MITHKEWIGPNYPSEGEKIAILGYSHYTGGGHDHEDMTVSQFDPRHSEHPDGDTPFYKKIADFFNVSYARFWQDVIFLNLIPRAIGGSNEKYGWAPHEWAVEGSERLCRVLRKHNVNKLFVFSVKAWDSLPELTVDRNMPLGPGNQFGFSSLKQEPHTVAFRLRHTDHARPAELQQLREAVKLATERSSGEFLEEIAQATKAK